MAEESVSKIMFNHYLDFLLHFPQHRGRPNHIGLEEWRKLSKTEKSYQAKKERQRQAMEYELKQLNPKQLEEYYEKRDREMMEH